jgi:hypothetical protein
MCSITDVLKGSPVYQSLSRNPEVVEVPPPSPGRIGEMPEVAMDCYAITSKGRIGTLGVHTCFAVCTQGTRTKDGKTLLGLAHVSIQPIHEVYEKLSRKLVKAGCEQTTIKTYVVGGMLCCEDGETSCEEQEQEVLDRAGQDRIVGARFNVVEGEDESLSVIFTPNCVRFSKGDLFEPTEEIGSDLDL